MTEEKLSIERTTYDPGWNDPPLFSYDSQQGPAKGYSLNKRVSYTMDNDNTEQKKTDRNSLTSLPPGGPPPLAFLNKSNVAENNLSSGNSLPSLPPGGPPPLASLNKSNVVENNLSSEEQIGQGIPITIVLENFLTAIEEVYDPAANEKESVEIKKRLKIMEKMWNEQKFPPAMQQKLLDISEGLQTNDTDMCDSLQRSVMVDYTSLCSTWMSAIRLLINLKRSKHQQ